MNSDFKDLLRLFNANASEAPAAYAQPLASPEPLPLPEVNSFQICANPPLMDGKGIEPPIDKPLRPLPQVQ